ncbi:MAG: PAS domain S-box protein [Deltaproteobacteria bacterium]|nr:PAS domain S-box protein [Deltaproteobacteria bacterium]
MTPFILVLSSLLQIAAGVAAWYAPARGGLRVAWRTISAALILMAIRRLVPLGGVVFPAETGLVAPVEEITGLLISMLLLLGVLRIRELWLASDSAREKAEWERGVREEAEEKWRRVFEFAPDGYILLGLDGVLDRMNIAACEISGLVAHEAEGKPIYALGILDEKDMAQAAKNLALLSQGIDPGPAEYSIRRADGTARLVEVIGYTLEDRGRTLMLTILHDITKRRRIEEQLRKNRVRLEGAQRVAGLTTWELDLATGTMWVDEDPQQRDESETHTEHATAFGRGVTTLEESLSQVHRDDRERVRQAIAAAISPEGKRESVAEYRQRDMLGNEHILRTMARVEIDESGDPVRLTGATLDVTDMRQAESEIRVLNAELEKRVRERTAELERAVSELEAFSYSVSHDLRSPLRAMAGYAEILLDEKSQMLDGQSRQQLERIRAAAVRMAGMIDGLLSLARLTRVVRNDEAVDLSALARGVVEELEQDSPKRTIDVRIQPGLEAWGDAGMLRLVLQNLIANAWKFTRDSPRPCIEMGRDASGAHFVRDNGAGFDASQVAKLFRPFERLHRVDEFEGSGIGLATVERIIRHHGGRVWADGAVGKGSTFTFTLGTRRDSPIPVQDED